MTLRQDLHSKRLRTTALDGLKETVEFLGILDGKQKYNKLQNYFLTLHSLPVIVLIRAL